MSMTSSAHEHDRVVTAFFDTRAAAEKAKADVAAILPAEAISMTEGQSATARTGTTGAESEGFWGSLKNIFAPEEDRQAYAEGLHRGGVLLTVHTSEADYDRVLHILDNDGAVDMNEREKKWRSEGWTGGYGTTGATGAGSAMTTGATRSANPAPAGLLAGSTGAVGTQGEEVIPIAEERLRVGKRDVNHGRVRVRSYVVEKPVNESINLHSERVDVSRRPVDRALSAGENLFQERTISAEEHDEEAVVSKDARVVEEVRLGKVAQDRTQEIKDSVRRTEVEVDDGRTGHVAGGTAAFAAETATGNSIAEHMEVLASDGTHVGTVDRLEGSDRIKLTRTDSTDGQHHYIPRSWVARVDNHVHLDKTAADVRRGWTAA